MIEYFAAHKLILIAGMAALSLVLVLRHRGAQAAAAAVPVDPYSSTAPSAGPGGALTLPLPTPAPFGEGPAPGPSDAGVADAPTSTGPGTAPAVSGGTAGSIQSTYDTINQGTPFEGDPVPAAVANSRPYTVTDPHADDPRPHDVVVSMEHGPQPVQAGGVIHTLGLQA